MTGNEVEKLLAEVEKLLAGGCTHTTGMVALSLGGAVCLACFREAFKGGGMLAVAVGEVAERAASAERANAVLRDDIEVMRVKLHRLADDALVVLSGAGIPTPAEGYVFAPHLLKGDIAQLNGARIAAMGVRMELERDLAQMMSSEVDSRITHRAMEFRIRNAAAMEKVGQTIVLRSEFERLENAAKDRDSACRSERAAKDQVLALQRETEAAQKSLLDQRDVLLSMKMERDDAVKALDATMASLTAEQKTAREYHDKWRAVWDGRERLRRNLALVSDLATALRGGECE